MIHGFSVERAVLKRLLIGQSDPPGLAIGAMSASIPRFRITT